MNVGSNALTNTVMSNFLGNTATAIDMFDLWIDGSDTQAGGAMIWAKDLEVKLAFEFNDEDVIASAMGGVASGHADEGVGCGGDEELIQVLAEVSGGNGGEGGAPVSAGGLAHSVLHAFKGACHQVVVEGIVTRGWGTDL